MRVTCITSAAFMSLSLAFPMTNLFARETLEEATDRLIFKTPIKEFMHIRELYTPATLDWTSDGCTNAPSNPLGYDFFAACVRHDFGYRNYKAQHRFSTTVKIRIDANFKQDMYDQCASAHFKKLCRKTANVYYEAVDLFGHKRQVEFEDYEDSKARLDGVEDAKE